MKIILFGLTVISSLVTFANDCNVDVQVGGSINKEIKVALYEELELRGFTVLDNYELTDVQASTIRKKLRIGASKQQRQIKGRSSLSYTLSQVATEFAGRDNPIYSDSSHNLSGEVITMSKDYVYTQMSDDEIYADLVQTVLNTIPKQCN